MPGPGAAPADWEIGTTSAPAATAAATSSRRLTAAGFPDVACPSEPRRRMEFPFVSCVRAFRPERPPSSPRRLHRRATNVLARPCHRKQDCSTSPLAVAGRASRSHRCQPERVGQTITRPSLACDGPDATRRCLLMTRRAAPQHFLEQADCRGSLDRSIAIDDAQLTPRTPAHRSAHAPGPRHHGDDQRPRQEEVLLSSLPDRDHIEPRAGDPVAQECRLPESRTAADDRDAVADDVVQQTVEPIATDVHGPATSQPRALGGISSPPMSCVRLRGVPDPCHR